MKLSKIAGLWAALGAGLSLASCGQSSSSPPAGSSSVVADAAATVGGGSWTQIVEVLDCRLLMTGASLSAADVKNGIQSPGADPDLGNGGPGNSGFNGGGTYGTPGTQPNNQPNVQPVNAACPSGMALFVLNQDGSYKISDQGSGNLTSAELSQVNVALSSFTSNDFAQPLVCRRSSAMGDSGEHEIFVTLSDGSVVTLAAMHKDRSCSMTSNGQVMNVSKTLLPIMRAHWNGSSTITSPLSPSNPGGFGTPNAPMSPNNPGNPNDPNNPNRYADPNNPSNPVSPNYGGGPISYPGTPTNPNGPANPGSPTNPTNPNSPMAPNNPGYPGNGGAPGH